ncbi:MAG: GNAT family N-acetyltransferase, partial [Coprobacillaceae bacterium]
FIAYVNDTAVGCVSFKKCEEGPAEIKRMFVKPEFRKFGIAKELLLVLEKKAKENDYQKLILETNKDFTTAINLYKKMNFNEIEKYGPYINIDSSICLGKNI